MTQKMAISEAVGSILKDIKKNWMIYFFTCTAVLVLNALYRSGDSSLLTWILAPTSQWAGILSGLSFEPLPGKGYVNETIRFLITPSCSGVRFLQIVSLMIVFSHTHRIREGGRKLLWLPFCFGFSYFSTVLVNGGRIALAIYLPEWMERAGIRIPGLSPDRLHMLIGTVVYFSFLLLLQPAAAALTDRLFVDPNVFRSGLRIQDTLIMPVFWYFLAVLAVPFAKRLITGDMEGFARYAIPIVLTCLVIEGCLGALILLCRKKRCP